jgi:hypothetical protein
MGVYRRIQIFFHPPEEIREAFEAFMHRGYLVGHADIRETGGEYWRRMECPKRDIPGGIVRELHMLLNRFPTLAGKVLIYHENPEDGIEYTVQYEGKHAIKVSHEEKGAAATTTTMASAP